MTRAFAAAILLASSLLTLPARAEGALERGIALFEAKKLEEAQRVLEGLVKEAPQNAEALYVLGKVLTQRREADRAVELLQTAVELDGKVPKYHLALAQAYIAQVNGAGMLKAIRLAGKIRDEAEEAVALDSKSLEGRQILFGFYLQAPGVVGGSVDKARVQAIEIGRLDKFRGAMAMAQLHRKEKQPDKLEATLRRALEVPALTGPQKATVYNQLGYLRLEQKRADEAVAEFQQSVAAAPEEANSHDSLGDGYAAKGETAKAIVAWEKAVALQPDFSASVWNLAGAYERTGDTARARAQLTRFVELVPKGKRSDEARERLEKLTSSGP